MDQLGGLDFSSHFCLRFYGLRITLIQSSVKARVRNYAVAITEAGTPELKAALREQLNTAIATHEKITNYMIARGFYHPRDLSEQLQVDLNVSNTALKLAQK